MSSVDARASGAQGASVEKPRVAFWNDPEKRGYIFQALLFVVVAYFALAAIDNAVANLQKQKIASGFGFWSNTAGFDIGQRLL